MNLSLGANQEEHWAALTTPLQAALRLEETELVHARLQQGDDMFAEDADGNDALMYGQIHSSEPCMSVLRAWAAQNAANTVLDAIEARTEAGHPEKLAP